MSNFTQKFQPIIERYSFGVCGYIADKLHMNTSRVRMYFIYSSFLTLGSPIILYLITAFWLSIRKVFRPTERILR